MTPGTKAVSESPSSPCPILEPANDTSGDALADMLQGDGHVQRGRCSRRRLPVESPGVLIADPSIDVVVTSGGTGLTG